MKPRKERLCRGRRDGKTCEVNAVVGELGGDFVGARGEEVGVYFEAEFDGETLEGEGLGFCFGAFVLC